jgi:hypothetical protein
MELIDFDEASKAWRANKKVLKNGMFAYKCVYIHSTGSSCKSVVEAQASTATYATHPAWTQSSSTSKEPWKYCYRHRSKGLG